MKYQIIILFSIVQFQRKQQNLNCNLKNFNYDEKYLDFIQKINIEINNINADQIRIKLFKSKNNFNVSHTDLSIIEYISSMFGLNINQNNFKSMNISYYPNNDYDLFIFNKNILNQNQIGTTQRLVNNCLHRVINQNWFTNLFKYNYRNNITIYHNKIQFSLRFDFKVSLLNMKQFKIKIEKNLLKIFDKSNEINKFENEIYIKKIIENPQWNQKNRVIFNVTNKSGFDMAINLSQTFNDYFNIQSRSIDLNLTCIDGNKQLIPLNNSIIQFTDIFSSNLYNQTNTLINLDLQQCIPSECKLKLSIPYQASLKPFELYQFDRDRGHQLGHELIKYSLTDSCFNEPQLDREQKFQKSIYGDPLLIRNIQPDFSWPLNIWLIQIILITILISILIGLKQTHKNNDESYFKLFNTNLFAQSWRIIVGLIILQLFFLN